MRELSGSASGMFTCVNSLLEMLLRNEVIQPHLPGRLPFYGFGLIAGPTFDGSLHKG